MRKCKREVILNTAAYFWLSCLKVDRALIGLKKCRNVFTTAIESLEKDLFFSSCLQNYSVFDIYKLLVMNRCIIRRGKGTV